MMKLTKSVKTHAIISAFDFSLDPGKSKIIKIHLDGISILEAMRLKEFNLFGFKASKPNRLDDIHAVGVDAIWWDMYDKILSAKPKYCDDDPISKFNYETLLAGFVPLSAQVNVEFMESIESIAKCVYSMLYSPVMQIRTLATRLNEFISCNIEDYASYFKANYGSKHDLNLHNAKYQILNNYSDLSSTMAIWDKSKYHLLTTENQYNVIWNMGIDGYGNDACNFIVPGTIGAMMEDRPIGAALPPAVASCGTINIQGCLDVQGFIELQKTSTGGAITPCLDSRNGMHTWYTSSVPSSVQQEIVDMTESNFEIISNGQDDTSSFFDFQQHCPMGIRSYVECNLNISQMVSVIENSKAGQCPPTLRLFAKSLENLVRGVFPGIKLYTV